MQELSRGGHVYRQRIISVDETPGSYSVASKSIGVASVTSAAQVSLGKDVAEEFLMLSEVDRGSQW